MTMAHMKRNAKNPIAWAMLAAALWVLMLIVRLLYGVAIKDITVWVGTVVLSLLSAGALGWFLNDWWHHK